MEKPALLYDGDCGFCRRWVGRWRSVCGDAVDFEPYQKAAARHPKIKPAELEAAVQWVGPDGERASGAEAVFRALAAAPGRGWWLKAYRVLPGFAAASEALYRLVSPRRKLFSRLDLLLWGPVLELPAHRATLWLFLRLLGLVYLAAFFSLWTQAAGLWGARGVLPASEYLAAAHAQLGGQAYRFVPSVFWLGASDAWLNGACALGAGVGAVVALGWAPGPALLALWALYLSVVSVGREFMSFQWDVLLLETGFLALLAAPWRLKPDIARWRAPRPAVWLLRLLLFRLMLESGAVKLLSGDASWRDLTALRFHYETQPLPTWIGWWFHQLPSWFHSLSCLVMFAIELGAPFMIFLPRRPRILCFWVLLAFQGLIALTGNYCFFNALTALLALTLLDDDALGRLGRALTPRPSKTPTAPPRLSLSRPAYALIGLLSLWQLAGFAFHLRPPRPLLPALRALAPFYLVNGYGLFAVMTTTRPEISIEGSEDGRLWREYEFKWKPGDPTKRPRWAAPHQPRLDWQMWFAGMGSCEGNEWLVRFMARLLEGSPPVLDLLARDPFEGRKPAFIRSTVYQYRFTRRGEKDWWRRMRQGPYCPVLASRGSAA